VLNSTTTTTGAHSSHLQFTLSHSLLHSTVMWVTTGP